MRLWHVTPDRAFSPKPDFKPGGGNGEVGVFGAGLFLTDNPELWHYLWAIREYGGSPVYAVEVETGSARVQHVGMSDRDQYWVDGKDLGKVKVIRTVPIAEAEREGRRKGKGFALLAFDLIDRSLLCVIDHTKGWGEGEALCGRITDGNPIMWTTLHNAATGEISSKIEPECAAKIKRLAKTGRKEAAMDDVRFGIVDGTDAEKALKQLLTLDSDNDGVPNYRDKAPYDPKVSAIYPDQKKPVNDWDKKVMHAVTKDKGFTFRDVMGDGPSEGFMVSVAKHNEVKIPLRDLTSAHVADYMSVHQQELKDPNNYLGGWVYKGNVYLDISRHTHDRNEAMQLARANKQLGIYDIGAGETLMTEQEEGRVALYTGRKVNPLGFVNALRADAGLKPLTDDAPATGLQKAALSVVRDSTTSND